MILTCPECATRYFVEDSRLGAEGRTVRCASCKNSWRAQAEEPLELTSSAEEGAVAREALSFKADEPVGVAAPDVPKVFRAKIEARRKVKEAATAGVVWAGMVSSFAAVFPTTGGPATKRYFVLILLDEPNRGHLGVDPTGGIAAAPTAGRVIERIAPFLGVKRSSSGVQAIPVEQPAEADVSGE